MNLPGKFKLCFLALLLPSLIFPQIENVNFDLRLINPDAQIFPIGDFGFIDSEDLPAYFFVDLTNNGNRPLLMRFRIDILLNNQIFAFGETDNFELPIGPFIPFSNHQLNMGVPAGNGTTIQIDNYDTDLTVIADLEDQILNTGRIPFGQYQFLMSIWEVDASGNPISGEITDNLNNHTLIITNPTSVVLLFPGESASADNIIEVNTTFPFFQWFSDASPVSGRYNISVFEKLQEHQGIQDVLNSPAIFQLEGLTQNFFQYPAESNPMFESGTVIGPIRPLEPGGIYYWQVSSLIPTASEPLELISDVFRFKVSDNSLATEMDPRILVFLEQLLGANRRHLLQQLQDDGFTPNGKMTTNGIPLDINDLLETVSKVIRGEIKIGTVEVY